MKIHTVELPLGESGRHEVVLLADHGQALAKMLAERDTAIAQMQNIRKQRDAINKELGDTEFNLCIAQQQLAEAVELLKYVKDWFGYGDLPESLNKLDAFLARHSQAEQQEAQGAQAGEFWTWLDLAYRDGSKGEGRNFTKYNMEVAYRAGAESARQAQGAQAVDGLMRRVAVALARSPEITPEEARYVRAAIATQPATIKLPDRKRTDHLPAEYKTMTPTRASIEPYNRALDDVAALKAVRGAEHE